MHDYLGRGTSNSIAFIAHEVEDINAASCTTWNGLPPATGKGTWPTTEAIKNSKGQGRDDNDIENIWHRYLLIALYNVINMVKNC